MEHDFNIQVAVQNLSPKVFLGKYKDWKGHTFAEGFLFYPSEEVISVGSVDSFLNETLIQYQNEIVFLAKEYSPATLRVATYYNAKKVIAVTADLKMNLIQKLNDLNLELEMSFFLQAMSKPRTKKYRLLCGRISKRISNDLIMILKHNVSNSI